MELKEGTMVMNITNITWYQYISIGDVSGCVLFDGERTIYAQTNDLRGLALPIGLSALGFVNAGKISPALPNMRFYRNGSMEIMESDKGESFYKDKELKFTFEVQEIFDLFDLIPKELKWQ